MQPEMQAIILASISIALLHTLTGPDHYLPFIVLSKTRSWSIAKTMGWTIACGMGHVLSSVLLGLMGGALGWSFSSLNWFENTRGGVAAWVMLSFGFFFMLWGIHKAYKNNPHKHFDLDSDNNLYVYQHRHGEAVLPRERYRVTPWVMFIIFILGPCEPMIPLLYFPAAQNSWWAVLLLITIYTICTLATMLTMVLLGYYGISLTRIQKSERYMHAFGGLTIFICGAGMLWMGW